MKLVLKTFAYLFLCYCVLFSALLLYLQQIERNPQLLQRHLSKALRAEVHIENLDIAWNGLSPSFMLQGFSLRSVGQQRPSMRFDHLAGEVEWLSMLRLWPSFKRLSLQNPQMLVESVGAKKLRVAGVPLSAGSTPGANPTRWIEWMMTHSNVVWHNGTVRWLRRNGELQVYDNISFVYTRQQQRRKYAITISNDKGTVSASALTNGNFIRSEDWDASLEILQSQGEQMLKPDDLSLRVVDGRGIFRLTSLEVQRVRDFLRLSGLARADSWILESSIDGLLHDFHFEFSGTFPRFRQWQLHAQASDVRFSRVGVAPSMTGLSGRMQADENGGQFDFSAEDSSFHWPQWFDGAFAISTASGQIGWRKEASEQIKIYFRNGELDNQDLKLSNLNAEFKSNRRMTRVSNLADLFRVDSIEDLRFEDGEVRDDSVNGSSIGSLYVDAAAQLEVKDVASLWRYLPKIERVSKFRHWWRNAVRKGQVSVGNLRYKGELSGSALISGAATLEGTASFNDVEMDYGFQRNWPILRKANGQLRLQDQVLFIDPETVWVAEDQVEQSTLKIHSLFGRDRWIELDAEMPTDLSTVTEFVFRGPLVKDKAKSLPIEPVGGDVDLEVSVSIPLAQIDSTKVVGTARVKDASFLLPGGVAVNEANGTLKFSEKNLNASKISASFLGHPLTANLVTTREAQPPEFEIRAKGNANIEDLQPWVGEHLLSRMQGTTAWQGLIAVSDQDVNIAAQSNLQGITIDMPAPIEKAADEQVPLEFALYVTRNEGDRIEISYGSHLQAWFDCIPSMSNQFLDRSLIQVAANRKELTDGLKEGINFDIEYDSINLDDWLDTVIDIARLQTAETSSPDFLDAMRTVRLSASDPTLFSRPFGALELSAVSVDGMHWIGTLNGDNAYGTMQADPRADTALYKFNLSKFHLPESGDSASELVEIDYSLKPSDYPEIELRVHTLHIEDKPLGQLFLHGQAVAEVWQLDRFEMSHNGVSTIGSGQWVNNSSEGSISSFQLDSKIAAVGDALQDMEFDGILRKGNGTFAAKLNWIGAPHEFEYARLNGDFNLHIESGELVQVKPGGGKLLGLLNFNAIARRLMLDFTDVIATGLKFDDMRYSGVLADGKAVMRDAHIFTPAVFVRFEGSVDLVDETVDLEAHISPELGGNLTLLSALASPTAGAVVFITQQLFKDEMRASSFKSYRAVGTWEDFEFEEIDVSDSEDSNEETPAASADGEPVAEKVVGAAEKRLVQTKP